MSYESALLALSPGQFLELQEASGPTASDASGNGRPGTYIGSPTLHGGALLAGEPSTYSVTVDAGAPAGGVTSSYAAFNLGGVNTFCGWAVRTSTANDDPLMSGGPGADTVLLRASSGGQNVSFWSDTNLTQVTWANALPASGTPFFWALTYNDTSKVAELFVNAVSQGTKTLGSGYGASPGMITWGWWGGSTWTGRVAFDASFAVILTGAQFTSLYAAGVTSSDSTLGLVQPVVHGGFA